jgi:hypothetical protein
MNGVTLQQVLAHLAPRGGVNLIYDIVLYIIFILDLILMFGQSDKETLTTIMAGGAAALAVVAKLDFFQPKSFGSFIVNSGMFILPLLVVGMSRKGKKVQPIGVISAVFSALYFFAFWFISQRG